MWYSHYELTFYWMKNPLKNTLRFTNLLLEILINNITVKKKEVIHEVIICFLQMSKIICFWKLVVCEQNFKEAEMFIAN